MVFGYKRGKIDESRSEMIAYAVLLMWQGLDDITLKTWLEKEFKRRVNPKAIRESIPHYLGEVPGYKAHPTVVQIKKMLSGEIP